MTATHTSASSRPPSNEPLATVKMERQLRGRGKTGPTISIVVDGLKTSGITPEGTPIIDEAEREQAEDLLVKPFVAIATEFHRRTGKKPPMATFVLRDSAGPSDGGQDAPIESIGLESPEISFAAEEPKWPLHRVILPDATHTHLSTILSLGSHRDLLYNKWNLKTILGTGSAALTLNFFGPSGTGKSLSASAIAHELGLPLLRINYSDLESKFVGEMNKNIRAAFKAAQNQNALLFFDEADSILGRRLTQVSQAADHGVNMARSVMLIELEQFDGVVIFASNLVSNYDSAFARRILHHVEFHLPGAEQRALLFQEHLPAELPGATELSIDALVEATEGLSGGEIKNIVLKAAARAACEPKSEGEKKVNMEHMKHAITEVRTATEALSPKRFGVANKENGREWMRQKLEIPTESSKLDI